jgi:hypothetical protein
MYVFFARDWRNFGIGKLGNWEIAFALPERSGIILAKNGNFPISQFQNFKIVLPLTSYKEVQIRVFEIKPLAEVEIGKGSFEQINTAS